MKTFQLLYDLEVVTCIHIGSGDEIHHAESFFKPKRFHRIDMASLFQDPQFDVDNYLKQLDLTNAQQIQLTDIDPTTPLNHILYSMTLSSSVNTKQACPIRELIKTARFQLYIPGSSIKGAIRTAIFWNTLSSLCKNDSLIEEFIVAVLLKDFRTIEQLTRHPPFSSYNIRINTRQRNVGQRLFELLSCLVSDKVGKHPPRYRGGDARFLRWLEISDTKSQDITPKNTRVLKIETVNTSRHIPLRFEVVNPGVVLTFTIVGQYSQIPMDSILNICDNFFDKVIDAEKDWYEEQGLESSFHSKLKQRRGKIRLGQGSGSWITSMLILADELGILDEYISNWGITKYKTKPKTRKLIKDRHGESFPLGWAQIRHHKEN